MTRERREAALEENNKQEGADNVQPKARMNGEKGDLKRKCKEGFSSAPVPVKTKFVQSSKGSDKFCFCCFSTQFSSLHCVSS